MNNTSTYTIEMDQTIASNNIMRYRALRAAAARFPPRGGSSVAAVNCGCAVTGCDDEKSMGMRMRIARD